MPLGEEALQKRLWDGHAEITDDATLCIVPVLEGERLPKRGTTSIDLRLGRWFRSMAHSKVLSISVGDPKQEAAISREHYVRFNDFFVLHPGQFVIGNTLEWMKLPTDLSGYVTGKSSWGRRGLIIETAAGIHPGFTGCLTLELANVGAAPIKLNPGMPACQVFFHQVTAADRTAEEAAREIAPTQFVGYRKPTLGFVERDHTLTALGTPYFPRRGNTAT